MIPAPDFHRLAPGIVTWEIWQPCVKCECGSTAIREEDGWVVFDPIPLAPEGWDALLAEAPLRRIVLTSGNHQRESLALRDRFQIPIHAPEAAAPEIEADGWHREGSQAGRFMLTALPGGATGESAWCDGDTLILGDALIHLDALSVLPSKYCSDIRLLNRSLKKLKSLHFNRITFAHGAPLVQRAQDVLHSLLDSLSA